MKKLVMAGAFTFAIAQAVVAGAQDYGSFYRESLQKDQKNNRWRDWDVTLGAGAFYEPITPGVDEYDAQAVPFVDITYKDRYFLNVYQGLGAYLYKSEGNESRLIEEFAFGVALDYDDGRSAKDFTGSNQHLRGLGDLDGTIEGKIFAEAEIWLFEAEMQFAHAVSSDGHDGWYAEAGFQVDGHVTENLYLGAGPSIRFASSDYMQAFYGVNAAQSGATQLSQYNPSSGIENVAFGVQGRYALSDHWGIVGLTEYQQLMGDAKDSPIVKEDGQFIGALAITYTF